MFTTKRGRKTGRIKAKTGIWLPGEFHLAMEAWILNSNKEILLQRRADSCEVLPGVWGLRTGRMLAGENSKVGCVREIQEELGLTVQPEAPAFLRRIFRTELIWDLFWCGWISLWTHCAYRKARDPKPDGFPLPRFGACSLGIRRFWKFWSVSNSFEKKRSSAELLLSISRFCPENAQ